MRKNNYLIWIVIVGIIVLSATLIMRDEKAIQKLQERDDQLAGALDGNMGQLGNVDFALRDEIARLDYIMYDLNNRVDRLSISDAACYIEPTPSPTPTPEPEFIMKSLGDFTVMAYFKGGNGLKTATGVTCRQGRTVAVDPKVIPYGTYLWIEGVGMRVAEDCGGFTGNVLDLYFKTESQCWDWGKRTREVWIVEGAK